VVERTRRNLLGGGSGLDEEEFAIGVGRDHLPVGRLDVGPLNAAASATREWRKPGQAKKEAERKQSTYELVHLAIEAAGLDEVQHLVLRELLRRVRPVSQGNDQHKRTQHNTPNQSETENETETERLRR
jgi:hypothetical protein